MRDVPHVCLPQDVAFPYMLRPGHAVDTFIVMEADFRWFEEECIDPSVWLPLVTGKVGLKEVKTEESGAPRPDAYHGEIFQVDSRSSYKQLCLPRAPGLSMW